MTMERAERSADGPAPDAPWAAASRSPGPAPAHTPWRHAAAPTIGPTIPARPEPAPPAPARGAGSARPLPRIVLAQGHVLGRQGRLAAGERGQRRRAEAGRRERAERPVA